MEEINVGIIEDNKTINQSLVASINMYPALELCFSAFSAEEGLEQIQKNECSPDIILLDIGLPKMDGISAIPLIKKELADVDIIMLTAFDEEEKIFSALSSGACSYLAKNTSLKIIMDSIFTVYRGGSYMSPSIARKIANHFSPSREKHNNLSHLTPRQLDVVKGLAEGLSYKLIADKNNISIDTVRSHIKKVYKQLQVNSKMEVVNMYRDRNRD